MLTLIILCSIGIGNVWGAEVVAYTLTCPKNASNSAYGSTYDATISGITWNAHGNQYANGDWRFGGKSITKTNRRAYSKTQLNEDITKIIIAFGAKSSSGITINSVKFNVYSTAAKAAELGDGDVSTHTLTYSANGTQTITVPSGKSWNGRWYSVIFNVTVSGSSNKYAALKSITFYKEDAPSCTAPNHVNIAGAWDRFAGEQISLTATAYSSAGTGSPIAPGDITGYQWYKGGTAEGNKIAGATSATYTKNNCTLADAGDYYCKISTGATCSTMSSSFGVKVYALDCYTGGTATHNFTRVGATQTGTLQLTLTAGTGYQFKVRQGSVYLGNNGTINEDENTWEFTTSGNNVTVNSGLGGTFTFTLDYSSNADEPILAVTYPRKTIYLVPNSDWLSNSAKFAYYYYGASGGTGWTDFIAANECGMAAEIPQWNGITVIAVRLKNTTVSPGSWDDKWNQTDDIALTADKNLITITGWNNSQTYTAYSIPTYTISYAKGSTTHTGGNAISGSKENETKTCGTAFTLPSSAVFTTTGYTQDGWATEDGGSKDYNLGGSYTTNAAQAFYPHWNANTYTLTWNLNGGTVTTAGTGAAVDATGSPSSSVAFNSDITAPVVEKDGYDFDGWNTTPATKMPAANTTYTAQWSLKSYTVTWYAGGTSAGNITTAGSPTTNVNHGSKVTTLPTNPDGSGCDKVFVGWTNTTSYTHGTSLLFTDVAGSPTINADARFYAVYATESGGSSTVFSEDFSTCSGTGGNSGGWSGSIASASVPSGISTSWYLSKANAADECLKLGTGSAGGSAETPDIDCGTATSATLTFRAGAWDGSTEGTTLSLSASNCSIDKSSVTLVKGSFTSYTVAITSITDDIAITFYTSSGNQRFFLDDVVVTASTLTYTGHTITCSDCGTSVTPTFTAAPTGGTVAVTKGGSAVTSGDAVKTCTSQDLSVTINPASHYTLTGFTASGLTTGTATISPVVAETLPKTTETTFTVTVSAGATGTLNLTPTFTEDAHVAINWNVNGVNQSIAATEGLTWVYSGGDLTALPSNPSVPAGCSGTKVFAGWSTKHSDATEEDAAWYDDLFDAYDDPTVPTDITTAKTFYAVFATSSANPLAGETMWAEDFSGFSADDTPSDSYGSAHTGTTVYNSGSVTYACTDGGTTTKIYAANLAGGTSPEILVSKSNGQFDVTGIPTGGQTELTLTYKCNKGTTAFEVSSATGTVTVGDASVDGSTYTRTITISQSPSATNSFALTFKQTTSENARLDDISLVVPGSGTMTDYVTLCAPSWTITYNKNTEDAVTNLPSPTSVLQSTGSGTLSSTIPERATYTFSGWAETTSGAVAYAAGGSITGVSADKTLYAVWTKTPVEELTLNYSELNKYVGDPAVTLEVTGVTPEGADPSVTWSSSNSSVASVVAATGVVTFGTVGTATITATSTVTGTTTAYCYVTVRNKPTASFTDLIHDGNGTDLSTYYMQNVAGTAIVFPTLDDYATPGDDCDSKHYIFVGWTTSDNNDDPEDHLVASGELEDDQDKVFYAVWADGEEGVSYTKLTSNSFETGSTRYVIGVESGGDTYYLYDCASTDANNSWGYTTNAPGTNAPIQFSLSGTASALVVTSTEATARYLTPLTAKNFQMSATSKTVQLDADGTIHNPSNDDWNLRGNSTNLRWYDGTTGTSAYFYKITAGSAVSYRTSCCTNNVPAPTVIATNTAYTVTLTWAAVDGATGYEVSWNGGAFTAATSPCVKSDLTASTDYTYKVRATYDPLVKCGALVASGSVTTDDVYSVTYSGGTGTGSCSPSGSVATASYEAGATVTLAPTNSYSLTSNTFAAWVVKDADDNDVPVSNNQFTMPAKNVTVTATWTAVQDKYYDRMHDGTDALHGGIADGEGKYYLVLEGCNYTVPTLTDDDDGDTDCHTTHYKLLGWIAQSHLKTDGSGQIKSGEESYIFQGGGTKSATGATYYAIWAIMTE